MAGHCVVACLLAKQNPQNGALWIEVVDNWSENDCEVRCSWCCQMNIAVGGERDGADEEFLRDDLIDDDELELMLLKLSPFHPLFRRRVFLLS